MVDQFMKPNKKFEYPIEHFVRTHNSLHIIVICWNSKNLIIHSFEVEVYNLRNFSECDNF